VATNMEARGTLDDLGVGEKVQEDELTEDLQSPGSIANMYMVSQMTDEEKS
jgi:hypothetical protein